MRPIRIALTKGRLEKDSVNLFDSMGLETEAIKNKGRRLILPVSDAGVPVFEVVLAKAADVITYVEHGVCDLGVVGKDTIAESGGSFYEVLDLGFGPLPVCPGGAEGDGLFRRIPFPHHCLQISQCHPCLFWPEGNGCGDYQNRGIGGAGTAAGTFRRHRGHRGDRVHPAENGLEVIEEVMPISARLIVNMACMKLRKTEIERIISGMESHLSL